MGTMILFEPESREQAIQLAKHFRDTSIPVQLQLKKAGRTLEAYQSYAARTTITNLLYLDEKGFSVKIVNLNLNRTDEVPLSEYLK